jgi:hypothetical protein
LDGPSDSVILPVRVNSIVLTHSTAMHDSPKT